LDCYFDPNERRYLLTSLRNWPSKKNKPKQLKNQWNNHLSLAKSFPKDSERRFESTTTHSSSKEREIKSLEQEIMDLKITNKGKDYFIEQLRKEREGFDIERKEYVEKLMNFNRKVGELETKLLTAERADARP